MNKENRKNKKRERASTTKRRNEKTKKAWEIACLIEKFFGGGRLWFLYTIRSKLLIANDMCWVVL